MRSVSHRDTSSQKTSLSSGELCAYTREISIKAGLSTSQNAIRNSIPRGGDTPNNPAKITSFNPTSDKKACQRQKPHTRCIQGTASSPGEHLVRCVRQSVRQHPCLDCWVMSSAPRSHPPTRPASRSRVCIYPHDLAIGVSPVPHGDTCPIPDTRPTPQVSLRLFWHIRTSKWYAWHDLCLQCTHTLSRLEKRTKRL